MSKSEIQRLQQEVDKTKDKDKKIELLHKIAKIKKGKEVIK